MDFTMRGRPCCGINFRPRQTLSRNKSCFKYNINMTGISFIPKLTVTKIRLARTGDVFS
jgi:hypothetical protein